jgi:RNA polymerase sigma-70 factor (ECF subfamily)
MHVDDEGSAFATSDDAWLIDRASRGDHLAYGELVRRYASIAHRTATSIVGSADAEDAVQEAFVRAFYALGRFRQGSPFKPWLLAIVANSARNKARSHGQQSRLRSRLIAVTGTGGITAAHVVESAETAAMGAHDRHDLARAIDKLPEKARLVVTCRYLLELSEAETAQVLGWPTGTVKSRLSRALTRLRTTLAENGPENRKHP